MRRRFGVLAGIVAACIVALPALAEPAAVAVPGGVTVMIPAGGMIGVKAPEVSLTLTAVTDMRCPSAYDCYWEGTIRTVFAVQVESGDMQTIVLCNLCDDGGREAVVAGHRLTLDRLEPDVAVIEQLGRVAVLADFTVVVTVVPAP